MDSLPETRQVEIETNQCDVVAVSNPASASLSEETRACDACGQPLESKPGLLGNWDAFPAGVKFEPTDEELLHHLAAEIGNENRHSLIENFISVLDGEDGICQFHPEDLPGMKKDGSSRHFFHRLAKAYTTGTRKRRKLCSKEDEPGVETRWLVTGKTREVTENGQTLGWKKIMVLHRNTTGAKKSKSENTNWILHQYHLGKTKEETDGELVVCKVFHKRDQKQQRQCTVSLQAEGGCEKENVDPNVSVACLNNVSISDKPCQNETDKQVGGGVEPVAKGQDEMAHQFLSVFGEPQQQYECDDADMGLHWDELLMMTDMDFFGPLQLSLTCSSDQCSSDKQKLHLPGDVDTANTTYK